MRAISYLRHARDFCQRAVDPPKINVYGPIKDTFYQSGSALQPELPSQRSTIRIRGKLRMRRPRARRRGLGPRAYLAFVLVSPRGYNSGQAREEGDVEPCRRQGRTGTHAISCLAGSGMSCVQRQLVSSRRFPGLSCLFHLL
jgi:hypothetical protein